LNAVVPIRRIRTWLPWKARSPAARDRGVDPEVDLVGESLFGELVGELAAAEGDQVPAVLGLEAGHALGELALD
jgi:hypothetical protein